MGEQIMTEIERAALFWYNKRQAFLDEENILGTSNYRQLLNECSDGEHALANAVRSFRRDETSNEEAK